MISVIIPLYNKEKQIANTLRTVLAQTYQDFEIVIVNDGSTDRSVEEVAKLTDTRIRLINQPNAGVSAARNRGIAESKGEYIAFLDADDEWKPNYLETIAQLIKLNPDCDVFATRYDFIDEYGNRRPSTINDLRLSGDVMHRYFHIASVSDAPLWTSAVSASKKSLIAVGGFPEGVTSGEDLLTWARLAANYMIAYNSEPMACYYTPTTGPTGKVPVDLQSTHDVVGVSLIKLSRQFPGKGIDEYVSFWYKMRAVINLGRSNRMASIRCAMKSIRYQPTNIKSWALVILSIMPNAIIRKALKR